MIIIYSDKCFDSHNHNHNECVNAGHMKFLDIIHTTNIMYILKAVDSSLYVGKLMKAFDSSMKLPYTGMIHIDRQCLVAPVYYGHARIVDRLEIIPANTHIIYIWIQPLITEHSPPDLLSYTQGYKLLWYMNERQKNILDTDMKDSNIMFSEDGPKIVDIELVTYYDKHTDKIVGPAFELNMNASSNQSYFVKLFGILYPSIIDMSTEVQFNTKKILSAMNLLTPDDILLDDSEITFLLSEDTYLRSMFARGMGFKYEGEFTSIGFRLIGVIINCMPMILNIILDSKISMRHLYNEKNLLDVQNHLTTHVDIISIGLKLLMSGRDFSQDIIHDFEYMSGRILQGIDNPHKLDYHRMTRDFLNAIGGEVVMLKNIGTSAFPQFNNIDFVFRCNIIDKLLNELVFVSYFRHHKIEIPCILKKGFIELYRTSAGSVGIVIQIIPKEYKTRKAKALMTWCITILKVKDIDHQDIYQQCMRELNL